VRRSLATWMPQFGEANVGVLVAAVAKADSPSDQGTRSQARAEADQVARAQVIAASKAAAPLRDASYGRKLVGTEGLSCISCHTFAGHKSLGIPAMDLAVVTRRLNKTWFHRYLLDPGSLRPGTRMPSFWPEGKSGQDVLDRDAHRQIDAIWAYLSLGKDGGLPPGLIQGKMELIATNEAIIYRNFIQGAGARGIGVAYPERANLAFDANELRLALIWRGPFIDAARHRTGRGDGFEGPLGYNVVKMPAGAPFAILPDAASKWPTASGKAAGYQMRGYELDSKRRPAFHFSFQDVRIEDYPVAVTGEFEPLLRRTLTLQSEHPVENLWFRGWTGAKIEPQEGGSFLVDGKIRLQFQLTAGAKPTVRQSDGRFELIVPVVFHGKTATVVEEIGW